jgi:hypothetical protein
MRTHHGITQMCLWPCGHFSLSWRVNRLDLAISRPLRTTLEYAQKANRLRASSRDLGCQKLSLWRLRGSDKQSKGLRAPNNLRAFRWEVFIQFCLELIGVASTFSLQGCMFWCQIPTCFGVHQINFFHVAEVKASRTSISICRCGCVHYASSCMNSMTAFSTTQ